MRILLVPSAKLFSKQEKPMRLKLTILGTIWVTVVLAAFIWFGGTYIKIEDVAWFYYTFGFAAAGLFSAVPFIIYRFSRGMDEGPK
jgi:uncharacterized membrane protein